MQASLDSQRRSRRRRALVLLVFTFSCHAPETYSLLGEPLFSRPLEEKNLREAETRWAEARGTFERNPGDEEAAIWLGRRTAYLGRFLEAVAIYSRGLVEHPRSPRLLRHRGHRYISLRRFDLAVADLEEAARLVRGLPDEVEPDGQPNARGIPTSTLQFNIWYHLGLARYLRGEFEEALRAYGECLKVSGSPDRLVATLYWTYLTTRRLGLHEEALRLLDPIKPGLDVIENHSYYALLLAFRGEREPEALLEDAGRNSGGATDLATVGYGVGCWQLCEGRAEPARAVFDRVLEGGHWPAFGYIAAEAELARLRK